MHGRKTANYMYIILHVIYMCTAHDMYGQNNQLWGDSTMTNITLDPTIPGSLRFARRHRCGKGGARVPCRRHRGAKGCGGWARTSVQTSV